MSGWRIGASDYTDVVSAFEGVAKRFAVLDIAKRAFYFSLKTVIPACAHWCPG
jgi:hypothetical protein